MRLVQITRNVTSQKLHIFLDLSFELDLRMKKKPQGRIFTVP